MTLRSLAVIAATFLAMTLPACTSNAPPDVNIDLTDSSVAAQLRAQLPGTLLFVDRMGAAEVAVLPTPLDVGTATSLGEYQAGDVAYWAAEQSLFVFLTDGAAVPGNNLVLVGKITNGMDGFANCTQECPMWVTVGDVGEREPEQ